MRLKQVDPKMGMLLFNALDKHSGKGLDNYGMWGHDEQELLGQILRAGDIAVDVGAQVGTLSLFLSRVVGSSGQVYAFEAQRLLHQQVCANMALNGVTNVHCIHKAVGNKAGEVTVPPLDVTAQGCHGCTAIDETNYLGETVELVTIDSLNLVKCRLLKVDVEGMELQVVQGAQRTITSFKPALFIRAHYDPVKQVLSTGTQNVAKFVKSLNYDQYWHFSRRYMPDNYFKNSENVFGDEQDLFILAVPHVHGSKIEGLDPVDVPE